MRFFKKKRDKLRVIITMPNEHGTLSSIMQEVIITKDYDTVKLHPSRHTTVTISFIRD